MIIQLKNEITESHIAFFEIENLNKFKNDCKEFVSNYGYNCLSEHEDIEDIENKLIQYLVDDYVAGDRVQRWKRVYTGNIATWEKIAEKIVEV